MLARNSGDLLLSTLFLTYDIHVFFGTQSTARRLGLLIGGIHAPYDGHHLIGHYRQCSIITRITTIAIDSPVSF